MQPAFPLDSQAYLSTDQIIVLSCLARLQKATEILEGKVKVATNLHVLLLELSHTGERYSAADRKDDDHVGRVRNTFGHSGSRARISTAEQFDCTLLQWDDGSKTLRMLPRRRVNRANYEILRWTPFLHGPGHGVGLHITSLFSSRDRLRSPKVSGSHAPQLDFRRAF